MWEKWTRFCEWNVQDAHDHPKKRAAMIAGMLALNVAVFHGIRKYAEWDANETIEARKRAVQANLRNR